MTPHEFVHKWRTLIGSPNFSEIGYYQPHVTDLCRLVDHPTPTDTDIDNQPFIFERQVTKEQGGRGRADVWYKGCFAIEYKQPGADLNDAYKQLLQYRESLQNPPLLIVSDFRRLVIHTNFTSVVNYEVSLTLADLETVQGLQQLRNVFFNAEAFRPQTTAVQVTEEAAAIFGQLATHLASKGNSVRDPQAIAHYLIRLFFCLFAEDIGLLPKDLFTRLVAHGKREPKNFNDKVRQLFSAMHDGRSFGEHDILHFNGGLFDGDTLVEMDAEALGILDRVSTLDWSAIEPAILGTLFTRSLDPSKRAQLGAHYTSRKDILLVIEPVLMAPLRREWAEIQAKLVDLAARKSAAPSRAAATNLAKEMNNLIAAFVDKLRSTRVLDPACGSGNFLYLALRLLLDLEKEVSNFSGEVGLQPFFLAVSPMQLYGIEINDYAHELAQATVWIGYLQWLHENGFGFPAEPILKPMDNIHHMDAILAYDEAGRPVEPQWPTAEVIVGNPPFLGSKKMPSELGGNYVRDLTEIYASRIPPKSDLVCYWFERCLSIISRRSTIRCGLIATQAIRKGANRTVLDRLKAFGGIFLAHSDRRWILEGAAVQVSIIGFDDGTETLRMLDGVPVASINSDLSSAMDITTARKLDENRGLGYSGTKKYGPFDIDKSTALRMLDDHSNPDGRPNSNVIKLWMNGQDVAQRNRHKYVIDFGIDTPIDEARTYIGPFRYVEDIVRPVKTQSSDIEVRSKWWLFQRPRPEMRIAISKLTRYIVTPAVSKHRFFTWLNPSILPDQQLAVIARSDDYFFGVLQSTPHEVWSRANASQLRDAVSGTRYIITTCFETFPFPWPPGQEPQHDPRLQAIAEASHELVYQRDAWLNPPGLSEKELAKRTLTNLYNLRPDWLTDAHKRLDTAVLDAYGWAHDSNDEEILARLLALNLERAK